MGEVADKKPKAIPEARDPWIFSNVCFWVEVVPQKTANRTPAMMRIQPVTVAMGKDDRKIYAPGMREHFCLFLGLPHVVLSLRAAHRTGLHTEWFLQMACFQ